MGVEPVHVVAGRTHGVQVPFHFGELTSEIRVAHIAQGRRQCVRLGQQADHLGERVLHLVVPDACLPRVRPRQAEGAHHAVSVPGEP
ncbi:hypothetical protein [Streptomyces sp. NPDC092370]|uniref:hypothetical protein n=1 Tax=Streptomyces sp. NPDC092370 TaxID=3366016 RepID=UPI00381D9815